MTIRPQPTFDDIKQLAQQLGVTLTGNRDSFDLQKSGLFDLHGTYRKNQAGFNAAFSCLVHYQRNLHTYQASSRQRSTRQSDSIGAAGTLALSLLAAFIAYTIGTFAPETRMVTGPLTLFCLALVMLSGSILLFGHRRK